MCRLPTRPSAKSRRAPQPGAQFCLPNVTVDEFLSGADWDTMQFPELCDGTEEFSGLGPAEGDAGVLALKGDSFTDSRPTFDVGFCQPPELKTDVSELDLLNFLSSDSAAPTEFLNVTGEGGIKDCATSEVKDSSIPQQRVEASFDLQATPQLQHTLMQYKQEAVTGYPTAVIPPDCGYQNFLPQMVQPLQNFSQLPQPLTQAPFAPPVATAAPTIASSRIPVTAGRRHAKSQEEIEYQQERVKKRRRESAQRSRARKNCYMKNLEIENKALKLENERLRAALSKYDGQLNSSLSSPEEVQMDRNMSRCASVSDGSVMT